MHIAFFTDCYRPTRNGVVTSITEAAAELHRRGHTITVITAHYPGYAAYEPGVYRVPSLPFKRDIELRLGLANSRFVRQIVESRAIDVIHTHTEFSLGWAARRLATSPATVPSRTFYMPSGIWISTLSAHTETRMFFDSKLFWLLMGILFVLVASGFKAFAHERGWVITWWKGLLAILWYAIFSASFYAWGTLIGENEASAGFKIFLLGFFVNAILGVTLWRLLSYKPAAVVTPETE